MSMQNTREAKRERSLVRAERKSDAADQISHSGVIVPRSLVRQHRYIRMRGLGHSASIASVYLGSTYQRMVGIAA